MEARPEERAREHKARIAVQATRAVGGLGIAATEKIHNTHDEILALRGLAQRQGWRHLILVTDPVHSGRAAALAKKAGLVITSSPGRYGGMDHEHPSTVQERLGLFRIYLHDRWMYHVNLTRGWL